MIVEEKINEDDLRRIGFAALHGAGEGFLRGFVAGTITTACESGMLGSALKNVNPGSVAALTVILLQSMKDSYLVVKGEMTQYELTANISKNVFVTSCGIGLGALAQTLIPAMPFAYMLGNFVGSFVGSFAYVACDSAFMSFATYSGWTFFGLVDQDYVLPDEVIREIGIDVSIGVSKTKTLSKIASEIAKSQIRKNLQTETLGVYEISKNNLDKILENTPIQEVWGIGSNLHKFFRKHNIINAKMFVKLDDSFIQRNLGKKGLELKMELIGIKAYPVIDYYVAPKSISRSSSFSEFTTDKAYIINELNGHLHRVCIKLRNHNLRAGVLSVMLRTKDFRVDSEKFVFDTPKDSEFELYETMHRLFNFLYKKGVIYRSSGVTVSKLTDKEDIQLILFESDADNRSD